MGDSANTVTEIRVAFKKTVSDRQYGNETAEVALTAAISGQQDAGEVAAALAVEARALVTEQLRGSPSESVQRALLTREEREARDAAERAEWERRNAEQHAEYEHARQRFAGAVADDGDEDDNDDSDSPF